MADFSAHPLWDQEPSSVGPIDPASLPLKPETILMLQKWSDKYNNQLNIRDFKNSNWFTPEERLEFDNEGVGLWLRVREELYPEYKVEYFSEVMQRHLKDPGELTNTG
jgi:hypothetical protein